MYFEKPESPRIFESNFFDFFTRVNYLSVPALFIPISLGFVALSIGYAEVPWYTTAALFLVGFVAWTLSEYWLHRTFFHWQPSGKVGETMHFFVHGVHHKWPNDPYRLVMPPWVNLSLLFFIVAPLAYFVAPSWGFAWVAGYVAGYMNYDVTHYFIHHHKPKMAFYKRLKAHHTYHHYNGEKQFGVSFIFWDRVFGTMK